MSHSTLGISAPHLYYSCPAGATVTLVCAQKGAARYHTDIVRHSWLFTPHSDQHCVGGTGPRHIQTNHLRTNQTLPAGLKIGYTEENMWMVLENVTYEDQGRYCCMVLDIKKEHKHASLMQKSHSHIVLQVTPSKHSKWMSVKEQQSRT